MIAAIDRDDLVGRCINIGGPEVFVPPRVADLLSGHFGRPIKYEELSLEHFSNRSMIFFIKILPKRIEVEDLPIEMHLLIV